MCLKNTKRNKKCAPLELLTTQSHNSRKATWKHSNPCPVGVYWLQTHLIISTFSNYYITLWLWHACALLTCIQSRSKLPNNTQTFLLLGQCCQKRYPLGIQFLRHQEYIKSLFSKPTTEYLLCFACSWVISKLLWGIHSYIAWGRTILAASQALWKCVTNWHR